jgi:tRNA A37 threonylcarbamoyladenosine dehydratase
LIIPGVGRVGSLLYGALTKVECRHFIDAANSMDLVAASNTAKYCNSFRVSAMAHEVAEVIYSRVKPYLVQTIEACHFPVQSR